MSGQKGPQYLQAGVTIANRTPFNKNIPNKRQTVNDGIAIFCDTSSDKLLPSSDVPFGQGVNYQIEAFLFCADVPTRLMAIYQRRSDFVDAGEAGLIPTSALTYVEPNFALNATPSIVDGYTAYTAANPIPYGQIATGTTETNGVKVRGYAIIGSDIEQYDSSGTRIDGADEPVVSWDEVYLDFSTRAASVNGYVAYNATGGGVKRISRSVLLLESDYTQAMQDSGNVVTEVVGTTTFTSIIVGLYKIVTPA